ncbi:metal-sensing transcriptional repressor [Cochlodiniinecator piscidefendens]|uniref:metal-sensing transcriptional repressor n=1 Tax=Cochlodiniinecator piscidefendens TaxID=2715756 RepID=UPI00140AEF4D|nr:metal-sensing transcriptional repressor [Cochlodiniinecator piscidefendens]
MEHPHKHASHPAISKRLKRANGHLNRVITMIDEGAACHDIAQQLYAVERALTNAKRTLIQEHIDHCLEESATNSASIETFKAIAKYL